MPDFPVGKAPIVDEPCLCIPTSSQMLEVFPRQGHQSDIEENLPHERLTKTNSEKEFSGARHKENKVLTKFSIREIRRYQEE